MAQRKSTTRRNMLKAGLVSVASAAASVPESYAAFPEEIKPKAPGETRVVFLGGDVLHNFMAQEPAIRGICEKAGWKVLSVHDARYVTPGLVTTADLLVIQRWMGGLPGWVPGPIYETAPENDGYMSDELADAIADNVRNRGMGFMSLHCTVWSFRKPKFMELQGDDNLPVTNIDPHEIIRFCNRASAAAGLTPCYDEKTRACDFTKNGFRMPTEAEWEYACRAGTSTHFYTGDTEKDLDRAGWYIDNSGGRTHPVAQKEPNAWGLYDMHGNVFEYCNDDWIPAMCFGRYLLEHEPVPTFNYYHSLNMTRGGSWFSEPSVCRSAARSCFCSWADINQSWYMGFRFAQSV